MWQQINWNGSVLQQKRMCFLFNVPTDESLIKCDTGCSLCLKSYTPRVRKAKTHITSKKEDGDGQCKGLGWSPKTASSLKTWAPQADRDHLFLYLNHDNQGPPNINAVVWLEYKLVFSWTFWNAKILWFQLNCVFWHLEFQGLKAVFIFHQSPNK